MDVKPDIVFLLGAGASKEAGVPDTVEFVKKFKEHIASGNNSNDIKTVNKITEILEEWKKSETGNSEQKIDVELLLKKKVSDLFILLLPTAFDAIGSFCFNYYFKFFNKEAAN